ncbi:TetR/AcrR family transcriptional regulator, partial [bacterium]
ENTSTSEIAKAAGTAAGTLFLYFPTKQDLVSALVLKIAKDQSEAMNNFVDPSVTAEETFETLWREIIGWFLENMDAYRFQQQVRDTNLVPQDVSEESGKYFGYFYSAIQKGLDEGKIKPYSLEILGGFLYQDIVAVMNLLKVQPDPSKQEETIQTGFEIFWNGIKIDNELRKEELK